MLLAGCSGGGSGSVPHATGSSAPAQIVPSPSAGVATAVLRLSYPARTGSAAAHKRKPRYLTASVTSLGITITSFNGSTTIPAYVGPTSFSVPIPTNCSPPVNGLVTCTVTFTLPPGTFGLKVTALDGANKIISEQQGTFNLVVGASNALSLTLDANTASIVVTPPATGVTLSGTGCPATPINGPGDLSLSCTASLTATQNFTVSLADSDTNAIAPTIGATVSATPGAPVLSASSSNANFSASVGFVMGTPTLTLTPGVAATAGATAVITVTATPATCAALPCGDGLAPAVLKFTASVPGYPSGVYVVNSDSFTVTAYAPGSNGNVTPTLTLGGNSTGLSFTEGLAFDGGNLYVSNTTNSINEYAAGSSGNATPIATITGLNTSFAQPAWLAFDSAGSLYVSNVAGGDITVYSAGANGNVAPIRTIAGGQTHIAVPEGVAFDSSGNLYVANNGPSEILVFAPGANGNVSPSAIIGGANTGLTNPLGLAFDTNGNLYVASNNEILVFAKGATGNVTPIQTIGGANTQLVSLRGVAVDGSGNIYAANDGMSSVTVYAKGSNGNVAPSATISGASTGLSGPFGIAVH